METRRACSTGICPRAPRAFSRRWLRIARISWSGIVNLLSGLSSTRLVCHTRPVSTPSANRYKHHRFPGEIISHGVWLYYRFHLSYRDVQELLFKRGINVTYEAIRQWCLKFGRSYANQLRRWRPRPGDKWHPDEVFLSVRGEHHYLWRAVDQDGNEPPIRALGRDHGYGAGRLRGRDDRNSIPVCLMCGSAHNKLTMPWSSMLATLA